MMIKTQFENIMASVYNINTHVQILRTGARLYVSNHL